MDKQILSEQFIGKSLKTQIWGLFLGFMPYKWMLLLKKALLWQKQRKVALTQLS